MNDLLRVSQFGRNLDCPTTSLVTEAGADGFSARNFTFEVIDCLVANVSGLGALRL